MLKQPILLPIALLLFLALLTFWINRSVEEQSITLNTMQRHDPDYLLYDFVSTRTDATGKTVFALAAKQMQHFPDHDTTELLRPRFTRFSENKPTMQVQSQRGLVSSGGETVTFMQQVKVVREATSTKGEMQLTTQKLIVEPDAEIAHTDQPVVIKQQPDTLITANGMRANHKNNTIELYKRVHVHYPPARAHPPLASKPNGQTSPLAR